MRKFPEHLKSWRYNENECTNLESSVKADLTKQASSTVPIEWYIDERLNCVDCNKQFTFHADEQKHWYEKLQFDLSSRPKRCKTCQKHHNVLKNEFNQLQQYQRNINQGVNIEESEKKMCNVVNKIESVYGFTPASCRF